MPPPHPKTHLSTRIAIDHRNPQPAPAPYQLFPTYHQYHGDMDVGMDMGDIGISSMGQPLRALRPLSESMGSMDSISSMGSTTMGMVSVGKWSQSRCGMDDAVLEPGVSLLLSSTLLGCESRGGLFPTLGAAGSCSLSSSSPPSSYSSVSCSSLGGSPCLSHLNFPSPPGFLCGSNPPVLVAHEESRCRPDGSGAAPTSLYMAVMARQPHSIPSGAASRGALIVSRGSSISSYGSELDHRRLSEAILNAQAMSSLRSLRGLDKTALLAPFARPPATAAFPGAGQQASLMEACGIKRPRSYSFSEATTVSDEGDHRFR